MPSRQAAPSLTGSIPQVGPGEDEPTGAASFDMAGTAMDDGGLPEGQAAALVLELTPPKRSRTQRRNLQKRMAKFQGVEEARGGTNARP